MIEYVQKSPGQPLNKKRSYEQGVWAIVTNPDRAELKKLAADFHLDKDTLYDVLDPDEVSRVERIDFKDYLFVRFTEIGKHGRISTAPLLIIFNNDIIMTISSHPVKATGALLEDVSMADTSDTHGLLIKILQHVFDAYSANIKQNTKLIQKSVDKLRAHKLEHEDFVDLVLVEDELSGFLGALTPVPPIISRFTNDKNSEIFSEWQIAELEDVSLAVEQSINLCNSNLRRIVSLRDAHSTISNNSLNNSMKVLTMATLLLALPNMIFGMYGMNISLPFQNETEAYAIILVGVIAMVLIVWVIARWRKFF
jgi:magnesium transporter